MAMKVAFDESFRQGFPDLAPKILREWSKVDPVELEASGGELSSVVEIVSRSADEAESEVLARLHTLCAVDPGGAAAQVDAAPQAGSPSGGDAKSASLADKLQDAAKQMDQVVGAVKRFEAFAATEAKRMRGELLPAAETKLKNNLWTSLFVALGLGFLLGLLLRGRGRS